ncbi:hypothetical protein [Spirosoma validum]|uniref:Uncharacterized protein n=1 Tax=Spirosoma validum TaxID=2771355 RepID=A0A927B6E7_9BACT|nr:hypothetical protein [Spirosoma validum]MBD2756300.1 hypothetical protein [Spirosoma validum]
MNAFLSTLKSRNAVLYGFGLISLIGGLVCVVLSLSTTQQVLGINAFIKPTKFFVSIWIFCWTMAWYTGLLPQRRKVRIYSWVVVVAMIIELVIITGQAALGKLSHFNVMSFVDARLFNVMGLAIVVMTVWTGYIGYLFFRHTPSPVDLTYLWGIRLGILVFVIFAFEGFVMAIRLSHTVGEPDGGPGLPVVNWSTRYGDLRVAHFFGMHALQLIPLFSCYVARRPRLVILLAAFYVLYVTFLLVQALASKPVLAYLTT